MKSFKLIVYPRRFWHKADLEISIDNNIVEIIAVNRFYEINNDFFTIFDTVGGQGTGYNKGNILRKINISECEFETIKDKE